MQLISRCAACFICVVLTLAGISTAQGPTTGTPPFGSSSGGTVDTVDLGNLNVNFAIPVLQKAGRGMPFVYDLIYDSSIWYPAGNSGSQTWTPLAVGWGWQGITPTQAFADYSTAYTSGKCGEYNQFVWQQWTYTNFVYYDQAGTSHKFNYTAQYVTSNDNVDGDCPPTQSIPASPVPTLANDGSGYTLYATPLAGYANANLSSFAGTYIYPTNTTDANGNEITSSNGVYTDTLGKAAITVSGLGTPSSPVKLAYTAPAGATQYTVNYGTYNVKTNFNCSGVLEYSASGVDLVSSISLPDGTSYTFGYEVTPGPSGYVTGRIGSVTLPTGGTITYTYSGGSNGIVCADGSTAGLTRVLNPVTLGQPSSTWTYARTGSGNSWQTKITDPQTNITNISFSKDSSASSTGVFYETQRVVNQTSPSAVLSTTITCYNIVGENPAICPGAAVSAPIARLTSFVYLPNTSGKVSETDTQYAYVSDPSFPTEIDTYDYGTGSPSSTILRKVLTQYNSYGTTGLIRPTTVQIQDGSGNIKASTTYTYDETAVVPTTNTPQHTSVSGARGNLTTLATEVSGSITLYRKFTYYDTGNLYTATDAGVTTAGGSNLTTYNYANEVAACGNAFPSSIGEPLSLSKSFTWNCDGAVMTSVTDENTQVSTVNYTGTGADPTFWRPYSTVDQLGNITTIKYPSETLSESNLPVNGTQSVADLRVAADGFGRPVLSQREQGYGLSTYDVTETDYDVAGRVTKTTQPFSVSRDTTCPTCVGTTTTYDALNRPLIVTDGGGGTVGYTYTFNDTIRGIGPPPTGENDKQRQMEYDGLGRLTSVCEITSVTGSGACAQSYPVTGFWTRYTYDPLGDMVGVTQNSQSSTAKQTRAYTYDMLGRLTTEANPETNNGGTSTYTYDTSDSTCGTYTSAGDLVEKKDPVGNYTCYKYDGLHRVTSATYPAGSYAGKTDQKYYVYDAATIGPTQMAYAKTRLAEAYTCTGSCTGKKTDLGFSYSKRGEIVETWELTPNSGSYYQPTASYWPNGALETLAGAGLPTITYGADGEGRPSAVSASSGGNPVTSTSYNTASQVTGLIYPTGDSDAFTLDSNTGRMTKYTYTVNGSSEIGALTWNPNGSLGTLAITDPFNSADNNQTCNYMHDDLGRIAKANCGTPWTQTFGLDPFGNVTKSGSIAWQPGYNEATNQYTLAGTSYDANGNLLNDSFHAYSWDSEGNTLGIDAIGLTYDALDRVVEQNPSSGTYYQIVYTPMGTKLGVFKASVIQQAYVPLPGGGSAEYFSWGLSDYRHVDWLGSDRMESNVSGHTILDDNAYAPYGEPYAQTGNGEISFTGQNKDTDWLQYDFLARQYDPKQGRWISPDPAGIAAVDPTNPQTWNRYAYVMNSPLNNYDPLGLCDEPEQWDPTTSTLIGSTLCVCPNNEGWGFVNGMLVCGPPGQVQAAIQAYSGSYGDASSNSTPWYKNSCITGALAKGAVSAGIDAIGLIPGGGAVSAELSLFHGAAAISNGTAILGRMQLASGIISTANGASNTSQLGVAQTALGAAEIVAAVAKAAPVVGQVLSGLAVVGDLVGTGMAIAQCH